MKESTATLTLAIDLGGLHPARSRTIDFDAQSAALGITSMARRRVSTCFGARVFR